MDSFRKLVLIFIPALLILAACGGGGDDDASDDDDDNGGETPASSRSSGNNNDSKAKVDVPTVKEGVFGVGSVRLEYSGAKDFKGDIEGNGIAQEGYTLLTFGNADAAVILSFQHDSKQDPGAISINTKDLSSAGEWGSDCSVTVEDGAKELKGNFECAELEAFEPGTVKSYTVKVKGNFSVPR